MKRITSIFLALILFCMMFTGCANKDVSNQQSTDNEQSATENSIQAIVLTSVEWLGLDTTQCTSTVNPQWLVSDSLYYIEADGTLSPNMAKSLDISKDGLTVTVGLADDLKFYDGTPLTAEDVKRSAEWMMKVSAYASDFDAVKSIEVNGYNVIFHLKTPSATFVYDLGMNMPLCIMKSSDMDKKTKDEMLWSCTPYGPYYVSDYVAGSHVTLKKNPYYKTYNKHLDNKGPAYVDTITVKFITDPFAVIQALLANEVDLSQDVKAENMDEITGNEDIEKKWIPSVNVTQLGLNNDYKPFSDPEICKALALLIDRDEMAVVSKGERIPAYSFIVPGMTCYTTEVGDYCKSKLSNNKEQGLRILADKGWKDSDGDGYLDKEGKIFEFQINYSFSSVYKSIVEYLQINFKNCGIKVTLNDIEDYGAFKKTLTGDTYQAFVNGYGWGETGGIIDYISYDPNIMDQNAYKAAIQKAKAAPDLDTQTIEFNKAQMMLFDSGCQTPISQTNLLIVYNKKKLNNILIRTDGVIYYNDIK